MKTVPLLAFALLSTTASAHDILAETNGDYAQRDIGASYLYQRIESRTSG